MKKASERDPGTSDVLRQLRCLQYLPAEHIPDVFYTIKRAATGRLAKLCDYIQDNWIRSRVFPPRSWSAFNRTIRTNNDCEGWHNRLNKQCGNKGAPNMYSLVGHLFAEAELVPIQAVMVKEKKLSRMTRRGIVKKNEKIFAAWDACIKNEMTVKTLLEANKKNV